MAKILDEDGQEILDEDGQPIYDEGPDILGGTITPVGAAPARQSAFNRTQAGDI